MPTYFFGLNNLNNFFVNLRQASSFIDSSLALAVISLLFALPLNAGDSSWVPHYDASIKTAQAKMETRLSGLIKSNVVANIAIDTPGEGGSAHNIEVQVFNEGDLNRVRKIAGSSIGGYPVIVEPIDEEIPGLIYGVPTKRQ
jgi:hypothetical protein